MSVWFTRRAVLRGLAGAAGAASLGGGRAMLAAPDTGGGGWTAEWDNALLNAEIARLGKSFDETEQMIRGRRGPEYNYQSNLRSMTVHPTRDSLEYASLLLYFKEPALVARAIAILRRVLPLQVQDPASPYFGLWSWYLEEPVEKMNSADFNWADFNGAILLNILLVHAKSLPADLVQQARSALGRAAACIRKRNVSLYYTNIASQGTYVTLAAAELLGDADLLDYAKRRCARLAATIDESGSFAEYNSPTYMAVTIENLTRIGMYVRDAESRAAAARLNGLAWKHIGEHWHAPTKQLAGPMSRAYSNDIGSPMWIQKGTGNRVRFVTLDELVRKAPSGEASIPTVDFRCPEELLGLFGPEPRHLHREVFIAGTTLVDNLDVSKRTRPGAPVEGTTLLTPKFALGSANRSDFWIQRRPLIAYWGDETRPPRCMQMRVVKGNGGSNGEDEYDFTSALLYSAQSGGSVLGSVRFRSDGGDKHPSLDPIKDGTFSLTSMRVELLLQRWKAGSRVLVDGKTVTERPASFPVTSRIALDAGEVKIFFRVGAARFVEDAVGMRIEQRGEDAALRVELMKASSVETVRWAELSDAGCDFCLWMDDSGGSLEELDTRFAAMKLAEANEGDLHEVSWGSGDGALAVRTSRRVRPIRAMDEAYAAQVDGTPYPLVRLEAAPVRY